jgi:hypothetical protein
LTVTVIGVGAIKTVNDRFAIFGSYNFGFTPGSPRTIALTVRVFKEGIQTRQKSA